MTIITLVAALVLATGFVFERETFARGDTINGAGASFPFPVYAQWAYKYHRLHQVKINYQSIGSGGGIAQIKAQTVDFGASDAPLSKEDLDAAGLIQFPMVIGGVVPVVNLQGIDGGELKLSAQLLADIFLGKITKWNDPAIRALNRGLRLPNKAITVVRRSDGSGTTWIFTNYLDKISTAWHETVGTGKAVDWPVGIGGKGNEGVATYVQRIQGAIGYVEYAYALQNKLSHILLKNRDGKFVAPTSETFQAAATHADWEQAPGFYMVLTDQPGDNSWPITGASFILMHQEQGDLAKAKALLAFFDWCYRHGADLAKNLHYIPMPLNVVDLVEKQWGAQLSNGDGKVWE
jgi:phosphate transport system substrate-binding protein